MRVLFLGGPRNGEHHEVDLDGDRLPSGVHVPIVSDRPSFDEPWRPLDYVLYTLRQRTDGWVYVAPGWPPPPKSCVVPGCTEPPRLVFTAAESGRLAGREWRVGDEVDTCPGHGNDIFRAQYVYGVDQLAEWLRPDARADLLDVVGIGSLGSEEFAAARARSLRMRDRRV